MTRCGSGEFGWNGVKNFDYFSSDFADTGSSAVPKGGLGQRKNKSGAHLMFLLSTPITKQQRV